MNARVGGVPGDPARRQAGRAERVVGQRAGRRWPGSPSGAGQDASALWAGHDAAQRSFAKRYIAPTGWLYDLVDAQPAAYPLGGGPHLDDPVLRPNQLFAVALPYAPLDGADPTAVRAVGRALLTPLGLRTLAPTEYGYQGTYAGPEAARDEAYHQGTAWPWLIGAVRRRVPCRRPAHRRPAARAWRRTWRSTGSARSARSSTAIRRTGPAAARSRPDRWRS